MTSHLWENVLPLDSLYPFCRLWRICSSWRAGTIVWPFACTGMSLGVSPSPLHLPLTKQRLVIQHLQEVVMERQALFDQSTTVHGQILIITINLHAPRSAPITPFHDRNQPSPVPSTRGLLVVSTPSLRQSVRPFDHFWNILRLLVSLDPTRPPAMSARLQQVALLLCPRALAPKLLRASGVVIVFLPLLFLARCLL